MERAAPPVRSDPARAIAGLIDRAREERFQRQLLPFSWELAADEGCAAQEPVGLPAELVEERHDDGSHGNGGDDGEPPSHDDAPADSTAPPQPPALHDAPAWQPTSAPTGWGPGGGGGDGHSGSGAAPPVQALPSPGDAPPWLHDMVERVAGLCAQGDPRFQHWSLTLPLDASVLPDSELRLSLSPGAMTLRFRTGSAQAAGLVCRYRNELHARLAALPSSPTEIDIDLE